MSKTIIKPSLENWVKLRHECSPFKIFVELQTGIEKDLEARKGLLKTTDPVKFTLEARDNFFTVTREFTDNLADVHSMWVQFAWDKTGITVKINGAKNLQKATLTLTDDAECKLKLEGGEELSCLQFRKRFLEDIFFNF
ncbi:MAG: hypothetical protein JRN15_20100 [Nitrososphaerota archaeon]|nr:hypothetical protein [Nitrososphaerota archaeon]